MATPDVTSDEFRQRMQEIWGAGDFSVIGGTHQNVSEDLCEAVDLRAGSTVLDIACGSGNTAIAAARRFCNSTGVDIVPQFLDRARERAAAERLEVRFAKADAEHLPFRDGVFDVVLSTYGVMFAPNQANAASEMVRVCRPGGKIGMANWTPESWPGTQYATISRFMPAPPNTPPPTRWGTEQGIHELFGDRITDMRVQQRQFTLRYRSPAHWLEVFRANLGPMATAFASLDTMARQLLAVELLDRIALVNRATDGTLVVPAEYLEVVMTRG